MHERLLSAWVGLDVGDRSSHYVAVGSDLQELFEGEVESSAAAVASALAGHDGFAIAEIALEASSIAMHLAYDLTRLGLPAAVYDARKVSRYLRLRRNKTDRNDAHGLAEISKLQLDSISRVYVKTPEGQQLRARLGMRTKLGRYKRASEQMLKAMVRTYGGRFRTSRSDSVFAANVTAEVDRLRTSGQLDISKEAGALVELCLSFRKLTKLLDSEIVADANAIPICREFQQVPGIGPVCALTFFVVIGDPTRFAQASDAGPYLGLAPKISQSGTMLVRGRISRAGNRLLRAHLSMAASVLLKPQTSDNPLRTWALQLAERAGRGKARTALARRLAVTLLAMWKSGKPYDPALARPRPSAMSVVAAQDASPSTQST